MFNFFNISTNTNYKVQVLSNSDLQNLVVLSSYLIQLLVTSKSQPDTIHLDVSVQCRIEKAEQE